MGRGEAEEVWVCAKGAGAGAGVGVRAPVFSVVSLGCPKNTVDSERMMGEMAMAGFVYAADPRDADICIVNTCGFLAEARAEAAEVLAELGGGTKALLVATGCGVEWCGGMGCGGLEADACVGFRDYARLPEICVALLRGVRGGGARPAGGGAGKPPPLSFMRWLKGPRMLSGGHLGFLKLGEGCSNHCAYCAIPLIRGEGRSRGLAEVLAEARELGEAGVKELVVIGQDTTAYGLDLGERPRLTEVIHGLGGAGCGTRWFRLLYAHPRHITDEILEALAGEGAFVKYIDLPLQHITDRMLRKMGRGVTRAEVEGRLGAIRRIWPGAAIRTTWITGHPGETEGDAKELVRFVKEGWFEAMGVFPYSAEPGTASAAMGGGVLREVAEERARELYGAQEEVWGARALGRMGERAVAMLDEREGDVWRGHLSWQMAGEDGGVEIRGAGGGWRAGEIVEVRLTGANFPDYVGEFTGRVG